MKELKFILIIPFLLVTITTSSCNKGEQVPANNQPVNLDIYLLIGQSNMAGRASIEDQDKDSLENVFLFTGIENNEWEKAANPLNKYSTIRKKIEMQKVGPGYTFSREMVKSVNGNKVGVVSKENTSTIDSTHFDSASQRLLGNRYAKEMHRLIQN